MLKKSPFLLFLFFFFSSLYAQYQVNGDASQTDENCFQLTPPQIGQAGSVWALEQIDLSQNFTVAFDIFLGCNDGNGADGIYFAMQPINTSLGSTGGGIGFSDIEPAIGVEFDTWQNNNNNDPNNDHIAIMQNGILDHLTNNNLAGPVDASATTTNIEDCNFHNVKIQWTANTQTLEVYFDCDLRISYTNDIINNTFEGDPMVFWGFTSGTGAYFNDQQVCFSYISFSDEVADQTICENESIQLQASNSFVTYSWEPSENLNDATIANPIAFPTETTTYIATLTDECNNILKDTITIFVESTTLYLGNDTTLCEGQSLVLDAGTNATNATYFWQDGSTNSTFTVTESGTYMAMVLFAENCLVVDSITIEIENLIIDLGENDTICSGESYVLDAAKDIINIDDATFLWNDGVTEAIRTINQAGIYSVEISINACVINDEIVISEYEEILTAINLGEDQTICQGETLLLELPDLPSNVEIKWQDNSNMSEFLVTEAGVYSVEISSNCGTKNDEIVISEYQETLSAINLGEDQTLCEGETLLLELSDLPNNVEIRWQDNSNMSEFLITEAGVYSVEISSNCETKNDEIVIDYISLPSVENPVLVPTAFSPNDDNINDMLKPTLTGNISNYSFEVYNRWGNQVFATTDIAEGWNGLTDNIDSEIGIYAWWCKAQITDCKGTRNLFLKGNTTLIR